MHARTASGLLLVLGPIYTFTGFQLQVTVSQEEKQFSSSKVKSEFFPMLSKLFFVRKWQIRIFLSSFRYRKSANFLVVTVRKMQIMTFS
jgi:hypothetical protein